jgi:hypothetical protein
MPQPAPSACCVSTHTQSLLTCLTSSGVSVVDLWLSGPLLLLLLLLLLLCV